jgi:hypothetical protein
VCLLLSLRGVQAQGHYDRIRAPQEYHSITVTCFDKQGKQTQQVFTTKQPTIEVDSIVYQAYVAYIFQLQQAGYSEQRRASGADFIDLTYRQERVADRHRKRN